MVNKMHRSSEPQNSWVKTEGPEIQAIKVFRVLTSSQDLCLAHIILVLQPIEKLQFVFQTALFSAVTFTQDLLSLRGYSNYC